MFCTVYIALWSYTSHRLMLCVVQTTWNEFNSILFSFALFCPVLSCPVLSCHVLSCSVLFYSQGMTLDFYHHAFLYIFSTSYTLKFWWRLYRHLTVSFINTIAWFRNVSPTAQPVTITRYRYLIAKCHCINVVTFRYVLQLQMCIVLTSIIQHILTMFLSENVMIFCLHFVREWPHETVQAVAYPELQQHPIMYQTSCRPGHSQ